MDKLQKRKVRKIRIRSKIFGTAKTPRLTVFRSNKAIYAQLVDDSKGNTLLSVSTKLVKSDTQKTKTDISKEAGKLLAQKAKKKKISSAVFDRNGYKYQGRVKALADGARAEG